MDPGSSTGWVFVVFGVAVFVYALFLQKGLARLRDDVDTAWSQLDAVLKEWTETVGKLLELNNGAEPAELKDTLTEWEKSETISQKVSAYVNLESAVNSLVAGQERHADRSRNESLVELKAELEDLKQKAQARRKVYNQKAAEYNSTIGQIPDALVASFMGLRRRELFLVRGTEKGNSALS